MKIISCDTWQFQLQSKFILVFLFCSLLVSFFLTFFEKSTVQCTHKMTIVKTRKRERRKRRRRSSLIIAHAISASKIGKRCGRTEKAWQRRPASSLDYILTMYFWYSENVGRTDGTSVWVVFWSTDTQIREIWKSNPMMNCSTSFSMPFDSSGKFSMKFHKIINWMYISKACKNIIYNSSCENGNFRAYSHSYFPSLTRWSCKFLMEQNSSGNLYYRSTDDTAADCIAGQTMMVFEYTSNTEEFNICLMTKYYFPSTQMKPEKKNCIPKKQQRNKQKRIGNMEKCVKDRACFNVYCSW